MTENKKENLNNRMIKFLFEGAPVRGACVQMAEEWQEMIKFHHYPENVAALLGQFTAGALLLSSTIKFEGSLILQVKGSGPIAFIYAEVRNPMSVRAMAEIREGAEIKPEMDLQELINKDGKGLCALILDPKDRRPGVQPYQGMVSLESNSVAENLENYMAKSEQLETKLYLAADSKKLGGLVIQKMPSVGGACRFLIFSRSCSAILESTSISTAVIISPTHLFSFSYVILVVGISSITTLIFIC